MIPDEDMFIAIREGRASVETDHIERFTKSGIKLKSDQNLTADVIITATGLNVVFGGEADISIDGQDVNPADSYGYKGMMYSCLLYTSPSPRDRTRSRMPSSA